MGHSRAAQALPLRRHGLALIEGDRFIIGYRLLAIGD
jgi:hypothetical protein